MTKSLAAALHQALDACTAVDVAALPSSQLGPLVVDLRRVAARLEGEIARFVHAAEQAEVWRSKGATSMESWLAAATNTSIRSAREQVRLADTIAAAPVVADKLRDGELSVDNALLIGAVVGHQAFADDVDGVIGLASGAPKETRKKLDQWRASVDAAGEADRDELCRIKRHLTFTPLGDGMVDVRGLLTDEDCEHVKLALRHIAGAAYDDHTGRPHMTRMADALTDLCRAYNAGEVKGGRERPKMLLLTPFETIVERAAARGVIVGTDATLSGEAVRRLACTAELHRVVTRGASSVLDFGTSTRFASDNQYLALAARDGGCRWPGCDRPPGWCEAHHIDEVVRDDGPTALPNLVLLCAAHHGFVHSLDWSLIGDAHDLSIRCPNGDLLSAPPRGLSSVVIEPRQLQLSA